MGIRIGNITFDCANPDRMAEFWGAAMGYVKQEPPPQVVEFLRQHLVDDMEADVERLVALAAKKVKVFREPPGDDTWTTMLDPEGNEFCIQPERRPAARAE